MLLIALYETSSGNNEEKNLRMCLGDSMSRFTEFLKDVPAPVADLTLHQLLTHTAGIPNPVRLAYAQGGFRCSRSITSYSKQSLIELGPTT